MVQDCEFKQHLIFEFGIQVTFSVLYSLISLAGIVGMLCCISRYVILNVVMYYNYDYNQVSIIMIIIIIIILISHPYQ